jgi:adenylate cyclase
LLVALIVTFAVIALEERFGDQDILAPLELQTLDWRFAVRGTEQPSGDVVLVLADDATVAELGTWPLPRELLAAAIDHLSAAGAGVIVVNLLLAESPTVMSAATRDLLAASLSALPPDALALRDRLTAALAAREPDDALARAIAAAGKVVLPYAFVQDPRQANVAAVPSWIAATAYRVHAVADGASGSTLFRGLIVPADALGAAAASAGHDWRRLEADGSLRAELPTVAYGEEAYPSLAIEAARLQLGVPRERMAADSSRGILIGERVLPLDDSGRQFLDHYGPEGTLPTHSLLDLVEGGLDPGLLAGRVVVLGASASGAGDRFATPFSTRLPGSEHLATAIDNILSGRTLHRGPSVRALDRLLIAVMALAAALLAGRRSPWVSLAALLALLFALAVTLQFAFVLERVWLAALAPTAAMFAAGVAVEALRLADERQRRRRLERQKANLARYFAPPVVERLAASDEPATLDRTQPAVVMFVDIVGFTQLSEGLAPSAAMALLRGFHTAVEQTVFAHGGMVDKFLGDGAMACFGVPDPAPTAAIDAIRAALALLTALATPSSGPRLQVGIGLHAGQVLMGDIGGATQFQFTVIGDTVNVASRLEALTRQHATSLIVSEDVFAAAGPQLDPALRARFAPLTDLPIRGRAGALDAWRLVSS